MTRTAPLSMAWDVLTHHLFSGRPFLASYKITYRCSLRCVQCPFAGTPCVDPTLAEAAAVLDRLRERGDRVVIFEGGEPLLWRDGPHTFNDLARAARQRFACVGATTNGLQPLDVDTDVLWVSVDGFAETHNRLRGAPIFERVLENVRQSAHPRLYAHITANAVNHAEIPDLVCFLSERFKGVSLQFYYPYGEEGAADPLFLPWPARRTLLDRLIELKRQGYPLLNSAAALAALRANTWRCRPHRFDNANPDGTITQGCYVSGRGPIRCGLCGFSPNTEMSLAFGLHPQAVLAGMRIFF